MIKIIIIREQWKRNEKQVLGPCWRTKKLRNMKMTVIRFITSSLIAGSKRLRKETRRNGNRWTCRDHPNYSITKIRWRCPWCNCYRRRKWTRRYEFKFWTRLIAFHIALIPLGKVWIQLFSLQLWVNSRTDSVLQPWLGNKSWRRKTLNSNLLNSA